MENEGELFCCEISKNRANMLAKFLSNNKIKAKVLNVDSSNLKIKKNNEIEEQLKIENQSENKKTFFFDKHFDKILLDAPCSGSGTRGRFLIDENFVNFTSHHKIQKKLISTASKKN